jgi:hypothetical protein
MSKHYPKGVRVSGYVVEASKARGGGNGKVFVCDRDKAPPGPGRAVGLGDLEHAQFYDDFNEAHRVAYWQLGIVKNATMKDGAITVWD